MVHLVLEIFSTFIFEGLCYGVGWGILNLVGVKRPEQNETLCGIIGILFWVILGRIVWFLLSK